MSQQTIPRITTTVTTTDATPTTAGSFTVPANSSAACTAEVIGRNTSSGDVMVATLHLAAKRSGGSAAQVGSTQTISNNIADLSYLLAAITMDVSGDDVRVRVTGLAGTTIEWLVDMQVRLN